MLPRLLKEQGPGPQVEGVGQIEYQVTWSKDKNQLTWLKKYASHGSSAQLKGPGRNQAEEAPDEQIGKLFCRLQGQNVIEGDKDKSIT